MDYRRSHTCGELTETNEHQTVRLSGWVHRRRDHGGLIFVDLRDRFGLTQVVFDPESGLGAATMEHADKLRNEDVLAVEGKVRVRVGGENPKLATGKVEVVVTRLDVLAKTDNPPFLPDETQKLPNEELRLTHRYIDLRRPGMQKILATRAPAASWPR